tara:strand:+ start:90 stop:485 length:396 start_codon:yes stop_codon:yes gene_type:complete
MIESSRSTAYVRVALVSTKRIGVTSLLRELSPKLSTLSLHKVCGTRKTNGCLKRRKGKFRKMTQQDTFLASLRGQYIMAQALEVAIDTLEKVEPSYMREESDIDDMKFLREKFNFPIAEYAEFIGKDTTDA